MKKQTIITLISFVLALIAFGLYYFYFAITKYGPEDLLLALAPSLFVAFFAGLFSYLIIKFIWIKTDIDFAAENEEVFTQKIINYLEKFKQPDGSYLFQQRSQKITESKGCAYLAFILVFIGLISEIIINEGWRIYTILGLIVFLVIIFRDIGWLLGVFKKQLQFDSDLVNSAIKIYPDRITVVDSGEEFYFKDIDWIEFYYHYSSLYLVVNYQNKLRRFYIPSDALGVERLFQALGFEKITHEVKSRQFFIIPIEYTTRYIFNNKNMEK